jgi:hypothetical protein
VEEAPGKLRAQTGCWSVVKAAQVASKVSTGFIRPETGICVLYILLDRDLGKGSTHKAQKWRLYSVLLAPPNKLLYILSLGGPRTSKVSENQARRTVRASAYSRTNLRSYEGVSRIQRFGGVMQVILVAKGRDDLPAYSGAPLMLCNHTFDKSVAIGIFKHQRSAE